MSFVGVRLGSTLLSCILAPAISKHSYGGMIFFVCLFLLQLHSRVHMLASWVSWGNIVIATPSKSLNVNDSRESLDSSTSQL